MYLRFLELSECGVYIVKAYKLSYVMLYDDSSSDDSFDSSDEDDLDFLLVCALLPEPSPSALRLNLADLTDCQSETMFRKATDHRNSKNQYLWVYRPRKQSQKIQKINGIRIFIIFRSSTN